MHSELFLKSEIISENKYFRMRYEQKKKSPKNDYTAIRRFFVISSEDFFENVVGSEQFQDT